MLQWYVAVVCCNGMLQWYVAMKGGPRDMLKMFLGIETPRDMLKMFFVTNNFMYLSQKSGHLGGCMAL